MKTLTLLLLLTCLTCRSSSITNVTLVPVPPAPGGGTPQVIIKTTVITTSQTVMPSGSASALAAQAQAKTNAPGRTAIGISFDSPPPYIVNESHTGEWLVCGNWLLMATNPTTPLPHWLHMTFVPGRGSNISGNILIDPKAPAKFWQVSTNEYWVTNR